MRHFDTSSFLEFIYAEVKEVTKEEVKGIRDLA